MQQGIVWMLAALLAGLSQVLAPVETSPPPRELTVLMGQDGALAYSPAALQVREGDTVEITLINEDAAQHHSFVIPDLHVKSRQIRPGAREVLRFRAGKAGKYRFFCDLPGHKDAGEVGVLTVEL
jgi:uncharacterized cupredoxin-like copper-binding protein